MACVVTVLTFKWIPEASLHQIDCHSLEEEGCAISGSWKPLTFRGWAPKEEEHISEEVHSVTRTSNPVNFKTKETFEIYWDNKRKYEDRGTNQAQVRRQFLLCYLLLVICNFLRMRGGDSERHVLSKLSENKGDVYIISSLSNNPWNLHLTQNTTKQPH